MKILNRTKKTEKENKEPLKTEDNISQVEVVAESKKKKDVKVEKGVEQEVKKQGFKTAKERKQQRVTKKLDREHKREVKAEARTQKSIDVKNNIKAAVDKKKQAVIQKKNAIDTKCAKVGAKFVNAGAKVVFGYDYFCAKMSRWSYILKYKKDKAVHAIKKNFEANRKMYLAYFLSSLMASVAVIVLIDSTTCYSYSYNGEVLGYVKDQNEVEEMVELVRETLSTEHGQTIQITIGENIRFEETTIFEKKLDDSGDVLNRLTYMQSIEATASGIYIDGELFIVVENEKTAEEVLERIKSNFVPQNSSTVQVEEVIFKEEVAIKEVQTELGEIKSGNFAYDAIMTAGEGEVTYVVKSGDTISEISDKLGVTTGALRLMNPDLDSDTIHIGQQLVVTAAVPNITIQTVMKIDYEENIPYGTDYYETNNLYVGDTSVKTSGIYGTMAVSARVVTENGEEIGRTILTEEVIKEPVNEVLNLGTSPTPPRLPSGSFDRPIYSYTITSRYGPRWGSFHSGIDLAAPTGTPIYAADGGTVTRAGWNGSYGYCIDISHGSGVMTRYAHLSYIDVSVGTAVFKGEYIGDVGNTGWSTGSHVHFEIRLNNSSVNPEHYLSF